MSISATGNLARSDRRTSTVSPRVGDLNPRLGRRRCSGIWPPSKPTLWKPPERDFWPLCPRPAVLPRPEPMPRPTRRRAFLLPSAGLMVFIRITMSSAVRFGDFDHVRDLADHAAGFRRVHHFDGVVAPLETEPAHSATVRRILAHQAPYQRHPKFLCTGHVHTPVSCSTVMPRFAAVSAGALDFSSASSVARTMLYGLVDP